MTRRLAISLCVAVLALFSAAPARTAPHHDGAPPSDADLDRKLASIAGEAMMDGKPYLYLEELSDDVGGRVTGSPQAAQAIAWGAEKMKSIGLENVHTETWQMSRGWTRVSAAPKCFRRLITAWSWILSAGWDRRPKAASKPTSSP